MSVTVYKHKIDVILNLRTSASSQIALILGIQIDFTVPNISGKIWS